MHQETLTDSFPAPSIKICHIEAYPIRRCGIQERSRDLNRPPPWRVDHIHHLISNLFPSSLTSSVVTIHSNFSNHVHIKSSDENVQIVLHSIRSIRPLRSPKRETIDCTGRTGEADRLWVHRCCWNPVWFVRTLNCRSTSFECKVLILFTYSPRRTIATAQSLYFRFHLFFPLTEFPYLEVTLTCLYVSSKLHDTLKKPREIILASYALRYPDLLKGRAQLDPSAVDQKQLEQEKKKVQQVERLVLETICFNFLRAGEGAGSGKSDTFGLGVKVGRKMGCESFCPLLFQKTQG